MDLKKTFPVILILTLHLIILPPALSADEPDALPLGKPDLRFKIASLEARKIMETSSGETVTIEDILVRDLDRDLFVIGELHDSYECHEFQRDFIELLAGKHPKLIVGLEFFERKDDEHLERWRSGEISEGELLEKTGWYTRSSQNYGFTRLIMDVVRKYGLKTVGLNVPRPVIHKVATGGLTGLTEEEKALFPGVSVTDPEHEFYIKSIFGRQAALMPDWFAKMYEAQKCWDVVMAESMRRVLSRKEFKGYKGVIIAGAGHVDYGLGIPFRYIRQDRKMRFLTIVPVMASEGAGMMHRANTPGGGKLPPSAVFTRGIGDYVLAVSPTDKDYYPNFGFSGKINEAGEFEVTTVQKESLAEKNGLAAGDVISSIDGVKIASVEALRLLLSEKRWDDSVVFEIRKSVKIEKD